MPTIGETEARIQAVERFTVRFVDGNGRNLRSDYDPGLPRYRYERAAPAHWTLQKWLDERFKPLYSGWDVDVLDSRGVPVSSRRVVLRTLRSGR